MFGEVWNVGEIRCHPDTLISIINRSENLGVQLFLDDQLSDLEYANNSDIFGESVQAVKHICQAFKLKRLSMVWQESVSALHINSDQCEIIVSLVYFVNVLQDKRRIAKELSSFSAIIIKITPLAIIRVKHYGVLAVKQQCITLVGADNDDDVSSRISRDRLEFSDL